MKIAIVGLLAASFLPASFRDDPPPEPLTCPLCGGNPILHFTRVFEVASTGGEIAARVLLWCPRVIRGGRSHPER